MNAVSSAAADPVEQAAAASLEGGDMRVGLGHERGVVGDLQLEVTNLEPAGPEGRDRGEGCKDSPVSAQGESGGHEASPSRLRRSPI